MTISRRLKEERIKLAMTEAAFGEICGVTSKEVLAWEAGAKYPDAAQLALLSQKINVAYVLDGYEQTTQHISDDEPLMLDLNDIN